MYEPLLWTRAEHLVYPPPWEMGVFVHAPARRCTGALRARYKCQGGGGPQGYVMRAFDCSTAGGRGPMPCALHLRAYGPTTGGVQAAEEAPMDHPPSPPSRTALAVCRGHRNCSHERPSPHLRGLFSAQTRTIGGLPCVCRGPFGGVCGGGGGTAGGGAKGEQSTVECPLQCRTSAPTTWAGGPEGGVTLFAGCLFLQCESGSSLWPQVLLSPLGVPPSPAPAMLHTKSLLSPQSSEGAHHHY